MTDAPLVAYTAWGLIFIYTNKFDLLASYFSLFLQTNILHNLQIDITVNGKELSTYGSDLYIGFLRQFSSSGTIQIRVHTFVTTFSISSTTGYSYIGTTSASSPANITIPTSFQVRDSGYEYRNL